jgi:hypothetical protein
MNFIWYLEAYVKYAILFCIIYSIYNYLTVPLKTEIELYANEIQQEAYICKTNKDIFDNFYLKVYNGLYENKQITKKYIEILDDILVTKDSNKLNKKDEKNKVIKNIENILIVYPKQKNILEYCTDMSFNIEIAAQNEYMSNYLKENGYENAKEKDITNSFTYEPSKYTHILCDDNSIYSLSFNEQIKLIENMAVWCKDDGKHRYVIIKLIDEVIFNNCTRPNIFMSSKHTKKEIKTGEVVFDKYKIKTNIKCRDSYDNSKYRTISVKETVYFKDTNKKRIYEYCYNITPLENIVNEFRRNGFRIMNKQLLNSINTLYDKQYIYVFKKEKE